MFMTHVEQMENTARQQFLSKKSGFHYRSLGFHTNFAAQED
jgi:hypothetical protein